MADRDLMVGVLAVQAGFATPAQVMSAASAWLIEKARGPLVAHLEQVGAITAARRKLLEEMADEALTVHAGDARRALESMGGNAAVSLTFGDSLAADAPPGTVFAEEDRPVPEERPGQYRRLGELGRGGQSIVRLAFDEFVGREVALKELLPSRATVPSSGSTSAALLRFLREARLTAQLDHPGVVAVHELARRADGTLFCAQKLVRGQTLKARLAQCETPQQRLRLLPHLVDACHAVAYAHSRGVVHRDLKPSNVMVGAFGETVVVDWGLAKRRGETDPIDPATPHSSSEPALTVAGVALGTPAYMSPEQGRGSVEEIDERTDVFSLGAILYELLTGRAPFEGLTTADIIQRAIENRFVPVRSVCPTAPAELVAVAERALRGRRELRYADADSLAEELTAWQTGGRVQAYEYRSIELLKRFAARNRAFTAAAAAAALVLIVSSAVILRQLRSTRATLASAFLDRAAAAESEGDWAAAAADYAAARVQHDSPQARWGLALSLERMPRRKPTAPVGGVTDAEVGVLADGRAVLVTSPDGLAIVVRELDSRRELWRATLPAPLSSVIALQSGTLTLYFGPLAEQRARTFDAATGRVLGDGPGPLAYPCTGARAAPRAWYIQTGNAFRLEIHRSATEPAIILGTTKVPRCTVSEDGTRLAARTLDGQIAIWDLNTLQQVRAAPRGDDRQMVFTAHGLAVYGPDALEMVGGPEGDFSIPLNVKLARRPFASGDGHWLASARNDGRVDVVDLRERRVTSSVGFRAAQLARAAFSADDRTLYLISAVGPEELAAWEFPSEPGVLLQPPPPPGLVANATFSGSGARLATVSGASEGPFEVEVWSSEGTLVHSLGRRSLLSPAVVLSGDGSRICTMVSSTRAAVWEVQSGASLLEVPSDSGCALSWNGGLLLSLANNRAQLWDVQRGTRRWDLAAPSRFGADLALSPDGKLAAWSGERSLRVYATADGSFQSELTYSSQLTFTLAFSGDGRRLAAEGSGVLSAWKVDARQPLWTQVSSASFFSAGLDWSRDGSTILLQNAGGTTLVDAGSGKILARLDRGPPPLANSVVSPDLRQLVTRTRQGWRLRPLPAPDDSPPERALAGVLKATGLELRGVDLVEVATLAAP